MIYPNNLETPYKIGVTATSDGFTKDTDIKRLERGIKYFKKLGYPVVETGNVRTDANGRSSDGVTRAKELMDLVKDSDVRVIFAVSGGNYLIEMLPYLDYELIRKNPTWIQGYSDNTGLTFTITTNLDMATIYGGNFSNFGMDKWHSSLEDNIKILKGDNISQKSFELFQDGFTEKITGLEGFKPTKKVEWENIYPNDTQAGGIRMSGRALGGNLDVLLTLVGTKYDKTKEFIDKYKQDGIVWFLESYDLNSEALTRGLWQLREAGWFEHAKGFIFGRPAMYDSYINATYGEVVKSVLGQYNIPIILDADIGHKPPQIAMINGAIVNITSRDGKGNITFERR
ncbi:MAG TPA: LD-carboxypeptidase [Clostridiales bacterium]|nr:LD-carboxypeptidase [Clostridiales bacterium]